MSLHFKGQLCDGEIHIKIKDLIEHNVRERHEKQRMKLKKLANNPALSEDAKEVLNTQIYYINLLEWYRNRLIELQKKHEELLSKDKPNQGEPAEAEIEGGGSSWFYVCGDCHGIIDWKDAYCHHCGRKVKWDG